MNAEAIMLIGAGGHATSCIDVIEQHGSYAVAGLIGLSHQVGTRVLDYPIIGTDADLERLLPGCSNVLIAVGQIETPDLRIRLFDAARRNGYRTPCIISPRAYVSSRAHIGDGSIVMHGAVVNAGASIGRNCIINSMALIEHDAEIGDHCHVATHATINGGVRVGAGTFIGSSCVVRQSVTIGERCLIGMGQQVLTDCTPGLRLPPPRRAS